MLLADLSEIDRKTLDLRGVSGRFKPENDDEAHTARDAIAQGASPCLAWWHVEDDPRAQQFRKDMAKLEQARSLGPKNSV